MGKPCRSSLLPSTKARCDSTLDVLSVALVLFCMNEGKIGLSLGTSVSVTQRRAGTARRHRPPL